MLPSDPPDPRIEWVKLLKNMPVPVMRLVPQDSLAENDSTGRGYGTGRDLSPFTWNLELSLPARLARRYCVTEDEGDF